MEQTTTSVSGQASSPTCCEHAPRRARLWGGVTRAGEGGAVGGAQIGSLAWELPYAGVAEKRREKKDAERR